MRYILPSTLAILIVGVVFWYAEPRGNLPEGFPTLKDAKLADRTIVDFGYNGDGTVSYSYLAGAVPEKIAPDEVPELRTENSYTKLDGVLKEGEDPTVQLSSVFFSQPTYAQDVDGSWKHLEYATTTEQAFRNRDAGFFGRIAEVFVRTAYADSVSPFSEAGDGRILGNAFDGEEFCFGVWSIAHDDTSGTADSTANIMFIYSHSEFISFGCNATIYRSFIPFSTSAIPGGSTISAATLNLYVTAKTNGQNDGLDYATIVQTSQATHTTLASADYDNIGATEGVDSGQRKDITSISTGAYLVFTLNSTGLGWIKKSGEASSCSGTSGITCLGSREGHDNADSDPGSPANNSVTYSTSENTGTSQDPYLSVTYSVAASAVTGGKGLKIKANSLRIRSGGLKLK